MLGAAGHSRSVWWKTTELRRPMHGVATRIKVIDTEELIFRGCEQPLEVGRYHSWVADTQGFPACLQITAIDADGQIMALKHKDYDVRGVQFHPESVLTPQGKQMMENWLKV